MAAPPLDSRPDCTNWHKQVRVWGDDISNGDPAAVQLHGRTDRGIAGRNHESIEAGVQPVAAVAGHVQAPYPGTRAPSNGRRAGRVHAGTQPQVQQQEEKGQDLERGSEGDLRS